MESNQIGRTTGLLSPQAAVTLHSILDASVFGGDVDRIAFFTSWLSMIFASGAMYNVGHFDPNTEKII